MFAKPADAKAINALITITIDSVDAYRKAADESRNRDFQSMFYNRANEREELIDLMQDFVRAHGEQPADDGSMSAGAHRLFMDLRDAVIGQDDEAIIAEIERYEDHLKQQFDNMRANDELSVEARDVIDECYISVQDGHEQLHDLKHEALGEARNMEMKF
jgi:uncharacterized protein (TIGR02284 family)